MTTIAGLVNQNGTIFTGSGFTAEFVSAQSQYVLRFPAGTWETFPIMTVTSYSNSALIPVFTGVEKLADGSATYVIALSSSAGTITPVASDFMFTAVGS